ncbi:MAG: hypothetical protein V2I46_12260 [Bacteroides sp.]|nr:hypothetical protein [Bacteroides sp.]
MKQLSIFSLLFAMLLMSSCDPNEALYEQLDMDQTPYKQAIEYTLTGSDYTSIGGTAASIQAFTPDQPAMDHIPALLARKFIALNLGSSALVTYNFREDEPLWEQAGFGYVLTADDYDYIGVAGNAFTPENPANESLPGFLAKNYPNAGAGDEINIIYNFLEGSEETQNLDLYEYDGEAWVWVETTENLPFVGYEFTEADYDQFGGDIAAFQNFSDDYPADLYVPAWLRNNYPLAVEGQEQVVKYRVYSGGAFTEIAHYTFDGVEWIRSSDIEQRTEQYIYGAQGWAFDPTVRFIMGQSDYMFLATSDPIPHATYVDFGYYFGASAYYSNFDMRLAARRTSKDAEGNYWDPDLGAILENEGPEAAIDEMFRRIVEEGLILLLQHKYPDAVPQTGGIDVHYIVGFETYNDNFSRSYLEAEYQCTAAGSPPQFVLIEGPRERE